MSYHINNHYHYLTFMIKRQNLPVIAHCKILRKTIHKKIYEHFSYADLIYYIVNRKISKKLCIYCKLIVSYKDIRFFFLIFLLTLSILLDVNFAFYNFAQTFLVYSIAMCYSFPMFNSLIATNFLKLILIYRRFVNAKNI